MARRHQRRINRERTAIVLSGIYANSVIRPSWYDAHAAKVLGSAAVSSAERELATQLHTARAYVENQQKRIRICESRGDTKRAIHLCHMLYRSRGAALVAASRAIKSWPNRRRVRNGVPDVRVLALQIRDRRIDPIATIWMHPKPNGGFREITSFSLVDRARQHLTSLSFGSKIVFDECQAGRKGKSAQDAVKDAANLLSNRDLKWVCELDITNCYDSIKGMVIEREYRIPRRIVSETLTMEGKEERNRIIYKDQRNELLTRHHRSTVRGLPQGSHASATFAYGLLSPILKAFRDRWGQRAVVVNCNDNFLIFSNDRRTLQEATSSLRSLIQELAVEITLHMKTEPRLVSQGIDFLGYRLTRRAGTAVVTLSSIRRDKAKASINAACGSIRETATTQPHLIGPTLSGCLRRLTGILSSCKLAHNECSEMMSKWTSRLVALLRRFDIRDSSWARFQAFSNKHAPLAADKEHNMRFGPKRRRQNRDRRLFVNWGIDVPANWRPGAHLQWDDASRERHRLFIQRVFQAAHQRRILQQVANVGA